MRQLWTQTPSGLACYSSHVPNSLLLLWVLTAACILGVALPPSSGASYFPCTASGFFHILVISPILVKKQIKYFNPCLLLLQSSMFFNPRPVPSMSFIMIILCISYFVQYTSTVVWKSFCPYLFFFFFLHICHTWIIQIIKLILILHKDNPSKYKMQFWNNDLIY